MFYLAQELIFDTFQASPGLPTAYHVTFPADVRVVDIPQQHEGL